MRSSLAVNIEPKVCGHMKKPSAVSSTVDWNHVTLEPLAGKVRKPGRAASIAWNISPRPP